MVLKTQHAFGNQSGTTLFLAKTSLLIPAPEPSAILPRCVQWYLWVQGHFCHVVHAPAPLPEITLLVNVTSMHPILEARTSAIILNNHFTASLSSDNFPSWIHFMSIHYYLYCQCPHPPRSLAWTTIIASKLTSLPIIHSAHGRQRPTKNRVGRVQEGNLIMFFTSLCLRWTKSLIWPKRTCMVWSLPTD